MALATAIAGTRLAVALDLISFEAHRFLAADLPVASVLLGGALFGAGMVLTGGCVSRLTVLVGTGNLRALLVLIVFAVTAHAVMKGALAPIREAVGDATLPGGAVSALSAWPGGEVWPLIIAGAAFLFALFSRARISHLAMAGAIGLLVPLGWIGTGFVLLDDFGPIPAQSMGFPEGACPRHPEDVHPRAQRIPGPPCQVGTRRRHLLGHRSILRRSRQPVRRDREVVCRERLPLSSDR